MKNNSIRIRSRNIHGSVQHYYHFILGYLLPLIHWLYIEKNIFNYEYIYIDDPKIMKKHLKNIFPKKIKFYREDYHSEINMSKTLIGFDQKDNYPLKLIRESTEELKCLLSNSQIFEKENNIDSEKTKKILIINRCKPDKFYSSDECERKGSGIERRSTPNLINIKNLLENYNYKFIDLENDSLKNQIKLFGEHDFIIAQHGAALSNIIFCKKNSIIIEIRPRRDKKDSVLNSSQYKQQNHFEILSQSLGLKYFEVFQEHNHSEFNLKDIVDLIKKNIG
tara:strand:+ start:71 stop:907 length:837 start_codon:yes stop_codon:yes gene_type:complete